MRQRKVRVVYYQNLSITPLRTTTERASKAVKCTSWTAFAHSTAELLRNSRELGICLVPSLAFDKRTYTQLGQSTFYLAEEMMAPSGARWHRQRDHAFCAKCRTPWFPK
jgi:hypothetical protein